MTHTHTFRLCWIWEVPRNHDLIQYSADEGPDTRGHQRNPEPVVVTPERRKKKKKKR